MPRILVQGAIDHHRAMNSANISAIAVTIGCRTNRLKEEAAIP
jgi:hypothetical protein